jgi:hypothetical protein
MGLDIIPANATNYSVKHTQILASEAGDVWIVFPPPGTPVPGSKKTFAGHPVYGGCVMLRHLVGQYGNRKVYAYTLYGHMKEIWVTEFTDKAKTIRTTVKKGDPLGLMGSTGESTGAHVHFEILFDPMDFLLITAQVKQDALRKVQAEEEAFWMWKGNY